MQKDRTRIDLTSGPIMSNLIRLALPIMSTAFMQMAYNLFDMLWIGRLGYNALTAVGTAGFYMWFSMAMIRLAQTGAEIGVAQALGAKKEAQARDFARNALQLAVFLALLYAGLLIVFNKPLISFFNVPNVQINSWAQDYLKLVALGMPFSFANLVFTSMYNGSGNSRVPFLFNVTGLVVNIALDPILIFGFLGLPALGVNGAAIATTLAQVVVALLFIRHVVSADSPFSEFHFFKPIMMDKVIRIIRYGLPMALQSATFTFFAMLIARRLSYFGDIPIAVQKVGSQIESISWMTAQGLAVALSAFVGQNYGAGQAARIREGYYKGLGVMAIWGVLSSVALIIWAAPIFRLFITESEVLPYGVTYLQILGVSQLFMVIEIATNGAFNGLGLTLPPSIISIVFTGLRVPAAYFLSAPQRLGLNGVWWSISVSSILKGIVAFSIFVWVLYHYRLLGTSRRSIKQLT